MVETLYPGINAHLNNTLLQPGGGWEMFHAEHLIRIREALDTVLPENYYAATEKSMQIGLIDASQSRTKPDVSVYQAASATDVSSGREATELATPILTLPLSADEVDLNAVHIYQTDGGGVPGKLITRIELLSPANMPGGSYHHDYMEKRTETLSSGVHLIELDYLNTAHPILPGIPSYKRRDEGAFPYYVVVSDLRPKIRQTLVFGVAVDEPLPNFVVPLADEADVVLHLQAVYDVTIGSARVFSRMVNYEKPIPNPTAYTPQDQERIASIVADGAP